VQIVQHQNRRRLLGRQRRSDQQRAVWTTGEVVRRQRDAGPGQRRHQVTPEVIRGVVVLV